ncbi:hypothetical protein AB0H63_25560 [Micromonospora echinospora]|uniref:hypothetical protein n=1 Tax=Micromonospora echinospora TaxID=1877 RepID=UPI0033F4314F
MWRRQRPGGVRRRAHHKKVSGGPSVVRSRDVHGVGGYRTITVTCSHYAEKNGVQYNTTSTMLIDIP